MEKDLSYLNSQQTEMINKLSIPEITKTLEELQAVTHHNTVLSRVLITRLHQLNSTEVQNPGTPEQSPDLLA